MLNINAVQASTKYDLGLQKLQKSSALPQCQLATGVAINAPIDDSTSYSHGFSIPSLASNLNLGKEEINQKISEIWATLENVSAQTEEQKAAQSSVTDSSLSAINTLAQTAQGSSQNLLDGGIDFTAGASKLASAEVGTASSQSATKNDLREELVQRIGESAAKLLTDTVYDSALSNANAIVHVRADNAQNLTNLYTSGADALTLADTNEEAANMLALQTQQTLGLKSLSLASQSAQSVLQLF